MHETSDQNGADGGATIGTLCADEIAAPTTATASTMLIVDDEEINRLVLENLFSDTYRIEQVGDGKGALSRVLVQPDAYCAILLDVYMDGMDGIQALKHLRKAGITEKVPVFIITSSTSNRITEEAYSLGVMDVIRKPIVPHIVKRRVESVIELFRTRHALSMQVASQQLELVKRAAEALELTRGMIEALAAAVEFRDGESGGHVRRIHDVTKLMLTLTPLGDGLSAQDIDDIALASIMHDIGKIAIPDAILAKPGKLTAEEFAIMKTHTVEGERLLESIPQLHGSGVYRFAPDIARHHHERWDGSGYPDGLAGDQISPWAQIVSLADVYDALTNDRPYKRALDRETACAMMRDGACGAFNPTLLDLFLRIEPEVHALHAARQTPSEKR